jgi:hypothetical protein
MAKQSTIGPWIYRPTSGPYSRTEYRIPGICDGIDTEDRARMIAAAPMMLNALNEASIQIEYLHEKFGETGSGNAVLTRVRAAIKAATGEA